MSPSLSHNSTEITLLLVNLLIKAAYSILLKTCDLSLLGARFLYKYIFIFCKPASPSLEPASRESLFVSPERIPPKNPKYGHNALTWCLLHAQCFHYAKPTGKILQENRATCIFRWNRGNQKESDSNHFFFYLSRIPYLREDKYGNEPVCQM